MASRTTQDDAVVVAPGPREGWVLDASGQPLEVPDGWALLPPGDAALTRRVRAAGPSWKMEVRRGRKRMSRGTWAPAATIARIRAELDVEREDPRYARKLELGRQRRAQAQEDYVRQFNAEVLAFLDFAPSHRALATLMAERITTHATPVGSGTVARTQRISVERRAESATIAWMRHQTTAYDDVKVQRVKGARRELRRALATQSRRLLERYRRGLAPDPACPLLQALTVTREDDESVLDLDLLSIEI